MATIFPTALGCRKLRWSICSITQLGQRSPAGDCCLGPPELGLAGHVLGLALHGNCCYRELRFRQWIFKGK